MEGSKGDGPRRRSMLAFAFIVTLFASVFLSFIGIAASLIFAGSFDWWFVAGGVAVALVMAFGMMASQFYHRRAVFPFYLLSTVLMGAMLYAMIASLLALPFLSYLVFTGVDEGSLGWKLLRWGFVAAILLPVAWGLMAGRMFVVRREKAVIPGLSARIVLISDLHLGLLSGRGRLAEIEKAVRSARPDLIVIAGDFIDTDPRFLHRFEKDVSRLFSLAPTFAVLGNHELYNGHGGTGEWMEARGARMLRNSAVTSNGATLAGVDDPQMFPSYDAYEKELLKLVEESKPHIVVAHQPLHFRKVSEIHDVLMLCGHTHAGQVWPMDMITRRVYPDGDRETVRMNGSTLRVSAGAGTWGPPMRLGSRSEMVVIDVAMR